MTGGWGPPVWMGGAPTDGETFVGPKNQPTARALLDAAEALGLEPHVVRAVKGGFIVPDEVWETARSTQADEQDAGF